MFLKSLNLYIYAAVAALIIGGILWYGHSRYEAGVSSELAKWQEQMNIAEQKAKEESNELQRLANAASISQQAFYEKQIEASKKTEQKLRDQIGVLGRTVIPANVVRLLNDSEHTDVPKDAGSTSQPSTTAVTADSTLEEQLNVCQRNYQERYLPLAEQTRQLQQLWVDTQKIINAQ